MRKPSISIEHTTNQWAPGSKSSFCERRWTSRSQPRRHPTKRSFGAISGTTPDLPCGSSTRISAISTRASPRSNRRNICGSFRFSVPCLCTLESLQADCRPPKARQASKFSPARLRPVPCKQKGCGSNRSSRVTPSRCSLLLAIRSSTASFPKSLRFPLPPCVSAIECGRTADFAYVLASAFWGRGIATEACVAAIDFLETELAVRSLYATVSAENHRSVRLLARLGFGEVDAARYPHGKVVEGDRVFSLALDSRRTR
ncbi:MAG: GNAT family N-acetyltransferase [Betaproteobacteria bacterium]|nr:MAG: GNAT family N-acetyltransferase [Betaproteobacteria bacterium]